ncbi:MAG: DUF1330 domain-containing protein [Chloroflexi bacterium]|nr:DUF1330 domain-containing protein [Chloroflexota bacterium]
MKGYVIVDTEVIDQEAYSQFLERIPGVVERQGGRFIVRTSDAEPVEGGWAPKRIVIMEFDSLEAARNFVTSDEYTSQDDLRHRAAKARIVVVEGVPEA